ncbi:hypothetical protein BD413DRAFT_615921 [Trametes elegans]|nr:hypothetical protein BD413DRAFT_615921 [Trametes elegans]
MSALEEPPPSLTPTRYTAPDREQLAQTSPHRFSDIKNRHPNKSEALINPLDKLDRRLQPKTGLVMIIPPHEFKSKVLPEPKTDAWGPSEKVVTMIRARLDDLFTTEDGKRTAEVLEDSLAETMVDVINEHKLCGAEYTVVLSRFGYDATDGSRAKVDAMMYPNRLAPTNGRPDWTHGRMFVEFKRGGTRYDPFNDHDANDIESDADTRTDVRAQLAAYAYNSLLYQHRTAIFALLVNGPEFRAMRYDYSGLIVTQNVNYLSELDIFLDLLAIFGQLDGKAQGFDPTATLLEPESEAYKLMDDYAKDPGTDLDYMEGTTIPPYTPGPPPDPPSHNRFADATSSRPTATASGPALGTRGQIKKAAARQQAAANAALSHDSDLDIEIPNDGEDPRVFKYVRERYRESLKDDWPRSKLEVGPEKRKFLVGKPTFCSVTLFGRGTRGYVALDAKSRRFVFFKDSWRPFYKKVASEGYYLRLFSGDSTSGHSGRAYVPRLLCDGDVEDQVTFTARYHAEKHPSPPPDSDTTGGISSADEGPASFRQRGDKGPAFRDQRHYRIISKDVCLPFESFTSAEQFVRCFSHCVMGHGYAYEVHGLLHRDVSSGNILILPTVQDVPVRRGSGKLKKAVVWVGIMTDWEVAKFVSKDVASPEEARQPDRTGTWQFLSVYYVEHGATQPITVADELESFFHVLLFYAIRRLHHNIENIPGFVTDYFDIPDSAAMHRYCSPRKKTAVTQGSLDGDHHTPLSFYVKDKIVYERFHVLIRELLGLFRARYRVVQYDAGDSAIENHQADLSEDPLDSEGPQDDQSEPLTIPRENPWKKHFTKPPAERLLSPKRSQTLPNGIRSTADQLKTHAAFFNQLHWACDPENLDSPAWPKGGDVEEDRLRNSHYEPRPMMIAVDEAIAVVHAATAGVQGATVRRADGEPMRKRMKTAATTSDAHPITEPVAGPARVGARRRGTGAKRKRGARR